MTYLVEVKNLKKNYGSKEAVKDISFNIKENEILGLLRSKWFWKNYYNWNAFRSFKAIFWRNKR